MKKKKRINRKKAVCAGLLLALFAGGCSSKDVIHVPQITARQVLKVDGESYSLAESKVYLVNYQNLYGTVAGVEIWQQESQKEPLEEYIKNLAVAQMTKILSMDSLAESLKISLEENELANVKKAAKIYYESLTEEEIDYTGADESDIKRLYQDYALAQKLYKSLTADINSEVSDDEARIMEAMQIVVKDKKTAKTVKKALKDGGDFATIAGTYNEADEVKIQFGRCMLPKKVEEEAFAMDNGAVSNAIKTKDSYYFIYCVNKFNEELTDANKIKIVRQREKEAFGDVYDAYVKKISQKLYQKVWDGVTLDEAAGLATDSFFAVYQEYCGELV